jgi:cytoskeletal protein CcmA (bactofilin family)
MPFEKSNRFHPMNHIEPLESRIAPAVFASFPDVDGDLVTVTISQGEPSSAAGPGDANIVLSPTGPFGGLGACRLLRIDLLGNQVFNGAKITVTAEPQDLDGDGVLDGDGLVNVGFINASGGGGIDLGAVLIEGDLGKIVAGDADLATPAVKSLSVRSLGLFGTTTGAPNLLSDFTGKLGALKVKTDVAGARLVADEIGPITIGGSVRQTTIDSDGPMGMVKIGGDWFGADFTGGGDLSATSLAGLAIGGSWVGGRVGGNIGISGDAGPIKIGGDIIGDGLDSGLPGSFPSLTGNIFINGTLASLKVGGSVDGSGFENSAQVATDGDVGPVKIGGALLGGGFRTLGKLASFTLGGSTNTSIHSTGDMGPVKIGGSVDGRFGDFNGVIESKGAIAGVTIGGSLIGGAGARSGQISAGARIGPVVIGGDVVGGEQESGYIHSTNGGKIASVRIGGSLRGGFFGAFDTGKIFTTGNIGPVIIGRDVIGTGDFSGMIDGANIASVSIGGSLIGDDNDESGIILSRGSLGPVKIDGDVLGGSARGASVSYTGYIEGDRIKSIFIGGSIVSGSDNDFAGITLDGSGSIRANVDIGSITVKGNLTGNLTEDESNVVISARGQPGLSATAKTDLTIGKITIGGSMTQAKILAGYSGFLVPLNADAQIGAVVISGDMVSSSILAGVSDTDGIIGDANDAKPSGAGVKDNADNLGAVSKIGRVIIKGSALGTAPLNDAALFGIEAQQIRTIKLGGAKVALKAGASNDLFDNRHPLGPTLGTNPVAESFDFHAFEVA